MDDSSPSGGNQLFGDQIKRILDSMVEGCQIVDFEDRYVYVNDAVVNQAKTTREALIGQRMTDVFPGIQNTEMYNHLSKCRAERKPWRLENQFVFPDGTSGWFELSIQPVPEGVLILSMDITSKNFRNRRCRGA